MEEKLQLAINTIFDALTTDWEDNGNIMADAVRDSVLMNLSALTGFEIDEIEIKIAKMIEDAQG